MEGVTDSLYSQPLLTISDINARIERLRKPVICAPDTYEQVRDAVHGAGLDYAYRVVQCAWLQDGQVLLGPSDAELDEMMQVTLTTLPVSWHAKAPAGGAEA